MKVLISTPVQASSMTGSRRSGKWQTGLTVAYNRGNGGKTLFSFMIPFWISHRYNRFQPSVFKIINL